MGAPRTEQVSKRGQRYASKSNPLVWIIALMHGKGNGRADIFHDDQDCQIWLDLLAAACVRYHVELHAYVVMRNHYHLFIHTLEANLPEFVHQVQTAYVSYYQYRYERTGHLYQGRYKAEVVDKTNYGNAVSRYIHRNPVKVGRWRDATIAEQRHYLRSYKWSSYRAFLGLVKPHPALVLDDALLPRTMKWRR